MADKKARAPRRTEPSPGGPEVTWDASIINHQSRYPRNPGTFGRFGNLAQMSCGFIAIHNVNQLLGDNTPFADTYRALNAQSAKTTNAGGLFGMNARTIARYFTQKGWRVQKYRNIAAAPTTHGAYIAMYFYFERRGLGAHYAAARYGADGQTLTVYNDDDGGAVRVYEGFAGMKRRDRAFGMVVWGIDRPEQAEWE